MYHFCVVCRDKFTSVENLRDHVGLKHKTVKFTEKIESSFIWDVISECCGGGQRWEPVLVPELARVFGTGSPLSYHPPDNPNPYGKVKPKPESYYQALLRICFSEERMLDMDDGMDEELCTLANQVD